MTQYEVLKLSSGLIESLELAGVNPGDHKYLRMFEDYREAEMRGEKNSLYCGLYVGQIQSQREDGLQRGEAAGKRLQSHFSQM